MRNVVAFEAPVVEVTLLEDRAHVVRRGSVELSSTADCRLVIAEVAPILSDKTLTASVAKPGATVVDTRIKRERVVRGHEPAPPAEEKELREEAESLRDRLIADKGKLTLLDAELADLLKVIDLGLAEIAADAAWGSEASDRWQEQHRALIQRERELRSERVGLVVVLEDLQEEIERLASRIEALRTPRSALGARLELDLTVQEAGSYEITVDYVVPGACWRPYHTAELRGEEGEAEVTLSTDGCVWQNTGEDWNDVQLLFSTERLSLGTEPPLLSTDRLTSKKKSTDVVVEVRSQEIATTGLGAGPRVVPDLPGIDDGGEVVLLRSAASATVPSDGRPYRTPISTFDASAALSYVLMSELVPEVLLKTVQTNHGSHPILAGPVDLIRDCGFVGRTSLLFIAPGESFALGWGPDGALRVHREARELDEKKKMLSSWITQVHRVDLKLSNISPLHRVVAVNERVPVSEIDKVQILVDPDETTDHQSPDEDGILAWQVELPGFGQGEVSLVFQVKRHTDVSGI